MNIIITKEFILSKHEIGKLFEIYRKIDQIYDVGLGCVL